MKKIVQTIITVLAFVGVAVTFLVGHLTFFPPEESPRWPPAFTVLAVCVLLMQIRHGVRCRSLARSLETERQIQRQLRIGDILSRQPRCCLTCEYWNDSDGITGLCTFHASAPLRTGGSFRCLEWGSYLKRALDDERRSDAGSECGGRLSEGIGRSR